MDATMNPIERAIVECAANSPADVESLIKTVLDQGLASNSSLAAADYRAVIESLLERRILRVATPQVLAQIQCRLFSNCIVGPVFGFPYYGAIDVSDLGAEHLKTDILKEGSSRQSCFDQTVSDTIAWRFPDRDRALIAIDYYQRQEAVLSISSPVEIGPWRSRYWQSYPQGVMFSVTISTDWPVLDISDKVYRSVLPRYSLSWEQWLCLDLFASGPLSRAKAANLISSQYKDIDNQNRFLDLIQVDAAITTLIEKGMVNQFDADVLPVEDESLISRIQQPSSRCPKLHELDLTPIGSEVHATIESELLGRDWVSEDRGILLSSRTRLYAASIDDLQSGIEPYIQQYEAVPFGKPFRIGRWCVRWWDRRYEEGHCLDLTINHDNS
jgi:hypothetical protein